MDPDHIRVVLVVAVVAFYGQLFPFALALYFVIRKGRGVTSKWLFVVVAPTLGYGAFLLLLLFVALPITVANIFFVPALKEMFDTLPVWLTSSQWLTAYAVVVIPVVCMALATGSTLYLWPRWPALVRALSRQVP